MSDFSLMDLFREEVASHASALTTGLLGAESTAAGDARAIEPLMRAAHSLKGAARVIGLDAAVDVAHAMEDVLVAAQNGILSLTSSRIDLLLRGVDWISALSAVSDEKLPEWLEQQAGTAQQLALDLEMSGRDDAPAEVLHSGASDGPAVLDSPRPGSSAVAADAITSGQQFADPNGQAEPMTREGDRAVKITAEVLTRFIGLSSEALVEAHRLVGLARTLQQLRSRHGELNRALAHLHGGMLAGTPDRELLQSVDSARRLLDQAQTTLAQGIEDFDGYARHSTLIAEQLFHGAIGSRQRPFDDGVGSFPRLVRDLARELGKRVQFEILGRTTLVDRDVLEKLEAPLRHLLQNAIDHGLETPEQRLGDGKKPDGGLRLEARHGGGSLMVSVADDGRGIDRERLRKKIVERALTDEDTAAALSDPELFDFLFLPGVTTRDSVDEVSGRGVGLDVVQSMVHAEGGALSVESQPGRGTRFLIRLPVTRSVLRALLVSIAGEPYAFALARIERITKLPIEALQTVEGHCYAMLDGRRTAVVSAAEILEFEGTAVGRDAVHAVVIGEQHELYAVEVDGFLGERELVVRPLDPRLGKVPHISAVSTSEPGVPVLILDSDDLVRTVHAMLSGGRRIGRRTAADAAIQRPRRILIVDDSITVREIERRLLENHGYEVEVAVDGIEGWNALRLGGYDLLISDIDMPRMNGIDLIKHLRDDPKLSTLPVMIVSYKDREEDRLRGLEAGADRYFAKSSFRDDALVHAVHDLIGAARP